MKKKEMKIKYEGVTLVEVLIAIFVAGVAVLVLLNISSNNMKLLIRNERTDSLKQVVMDSAVEIRKLAEENSSDPLYPGNFLIGSAGACFDLDGTSGVQTSRPIVYGHDGTNDITDDVVIEYCLIDASSGNQRRGKIVAVIQDCSGDHCSYEYSLSLTLIRR